MPVCKFVRDRRKELGLRIVDVHRLTGIHQSELQRMDVEERAYFTEHQVKSLCRALETTPNHLFGWHGDIVSSTDWAHKKIDTLSERNAELEKKLSANKRLLNSVKKSLRDAIDSAIFDYESADD